MNDTGESNRETSPGDRTEDRVVPVDITPEDVALVENSMDRAEVERAREDAADIDPALRAQLEIERVETVSDQAKRTEAARVEDARVGVERAGADQAEVRSGKVPPVQRRGSVVPMVIGGVLAAAVGFGLAQVVPQGWPLMDTSAISDEVKSQSATIAELQTRVAALAEAPASVMDPAVLDRLAAVETAVANVPAPVGVPADLTARLDAVEQRLAAAPVQADGTAGFAPSGDTAALAQLQAEIATLKTGGASLDTKMAQATEQLDSIRAEAEAVVTEAAARSALHQLQAAVDSGAPYGSALADLAGATVPEVLTAHAAAGLPSLQSLRASFPQAARAALDVSLQAASGDSWTDRVGIFLRNQTGARSLTPREGADPDAVLSRAEAALATGDLTQTMTERGGLPEAGKTAMADWLAQAQLRLDATAAVQALSAGLGQ
ncbi:MAG: hypothetical protein H7245_04690 [Candidatus Saccharibacteria bacterium]|nr:hypothetical protein [Pseudorhodobacter sp.]